MAKDDKDERTITTIIPDLDPNAKPSPVDVIALSEKLEELRNSVTATPSTTMQPMPSINDFFGISSADRTEFLRLAGQMLQRLSNELTNINSAENINGLFHELSVFQETLAQAITVEFLEEELKKPKYKGKTFDELFEEAEKDENGNPIKKSLYSQASRALSKYWREATGRKLRTAARAGDHHEIIKKDRLAVPTLTGYLNAINLFEEGNAYLTNIRTNGLQFEDGKLYFSGERAKMVSEMELQKLKTKEAVENINLPFLQFYYTQLFAKWEEAIAAKSRGGNENEIAIEEVTKFYLPDLARARGLPGNASSESIEAIKNDIAAFHDIVGVLKEGYKSPSYFPVLNFEGYDSTTNTISISSPYLMGVVKKIYKDSIRRLKDNTPKLKNDGTPQTRAANSYLIHSDIQKERNKAAVQTVWIVVQNLERCGKHEYHIAAKTIIKRNPLLNIQLEKSKNKRQVLQRHFKKAWELLRDKTDLTTTYKNIVLPDPENPANIPTVKGLNDFIIKITHEGKQRNKNT